MHDQPNQPFGARRRFRPIPVRLLVPNVITLIAIVAGITAIRMAVEGRMEWAMAGIAFAAVLDGIDGRVARLIKGQSRFGAELDSLADFVNFGVAPALILYFWQLHQMGNFGWIVVILFAISGALRLARFNATMDDPNKPDWAANYFTGVPAPAGAILVLLPIYLSFLGYVSMPSGLIAIYTIGIAVLMVSRVPVFSGKKLGGRVAPEMVMPVVIIAVIMLALLISYPWHMLAWCSLIYLCSLPLGWLSYRRRERESAAQGQMSGESEGIVESPPMTPPASGEQPERPARLN